MTYHLYNGTKDVANSNSNLQFYASLISRNILEKISRQIAKLRKFNTNQSLFIILPMMLGS